MPPRGAAGPRDLRAREQALLEADRLIDRLRAETARARAVLVDCAAHPDEARSRPVDAALRVFALRYLQALAPEGPIERGLAAAAETPWQAAAVAELVRALRRQAVDLSARIPPRRRPPGRAA